MHAAFSSVKLMDSLIFLLFATLDSSDDPRLVSSSVNTWITFTFGSTGLPSCYLAGEAIQHPNVAMAEGAAVAAEALEVIIVVGLSCG